VRQLRSSLLPATDEAIDATRELSMNRLRRFAACALVLAAAPAAWSAGNQGASQAQQRYQQERAACLSGQSQQDRATCLREAGAAREEARRGRLDNGAGASASLEQNAVARCNAQPAADREACVQRIMGAGSTQGGVESGGLIRQTETPVTPAR
jgi:hypothetical protein